MLANVIVMLFLVFFYMWIYCDIETHSSLMLFELGESFMKL
jgi:hypothetical protein